MKILFKLWNEISYKINLKHFIINKYELSSVLDTLYTSLKFKFEISKIKLLDSWFEYIFNKFEFVI